MKNQKNQITKKKKGFTLVELMAVIAIIAILAAVLVPTVTGYINRSKKTAVIAQIRNAVSAVEVWNATAEAGTIIGDDITLGAAKETIEPDAGSSTDVDADISMGDVSKVSEVTLAVARQINSDPNAIKKIDIDAAGIFKAYSAE